MMLLFKVLIFITFLPHLCSCIYSSYLQFFLKSPLSINLVNMSSNYLIEETKWRLTCLLSIFIFLL